MAGYEMQWSGVIPDGKRGRRDPVEMEKYHSTFQVTREGKNRLVKKAMGNEMQLRGKTKTLGIGEE
ncbi:hypothetical protein N7466_007590 [Penicillium verhagenii]|uniref:uncharacterized protein n=1 Tax=Penicillium verhagenii TaxID=1562060 RepID=UPI0025456315|nr:uncharacterized protein N7466_007590 [Penicillium verhagenii]KAJ5928634.1 hypothetical protein N7466_007590 [Penicillium verhagenii]